MLFEESTARDLNPIVEEGSANTQTSSSEIEPATAHSESSQNANHENTTLTTETAETTALATENPPASALEHETVAQHAPESPREEMDFAAALESFEAEQSAAEAAAPADDHIQKGTVVKLTDKYVVVDVGSKSEGMVPIAQVMGRDGQPRFKPGDSIDVVSDRGETEEGYALLSHEKAARVRVWEDIEKAYNDKSTIKGYVVDRVKGGLSVDVGGVRAALPGSQVDLKPVRTLDGFKGHEIDVRVIKLNKKRGNIVVSRKQLLEEEQADKRSKTLEHLEEGAVLTGSVKNLTDYGAFVDLGGLDGLLHITDMSWGRLTHPRDLVNVGDEIDVVVLKFDRETERVSLGTKQLTEDPWAHVPTKYPAGSRVSGRVTNVTDYGAFVELEGGVEGLVHVSEMSWSQKIKNPSKVVSPGDTVEAVVSDVNPEARRISLSLKDTLPDPWESVLQKFGVGSRVSGKVRNLTDFGAFVEIEEGVDGHVHVSDMSW